MVERQIKAGLQDGSKDKTLKQKSVEKVKDEFKHGKKIDQNWCTRWLKGQSRGVGKCWEDKNEFKHGRKIDQDWYG